MKKTYFFLFLLLWAHSSYAQPRLYLNLTSHNEMNGEDYDTDSVLFTVSTGHVRDIAQLVVTKNAKWNFQTNSKYVLAVHKYQHADTSHSDILEWMHNTSRITIDPRPKKQLPFYNYNIADVVYLLDSAGVPDSRTVGGFIYYPYTSADWTPYLSPVIGARYGNSWQAQILWGAGSTPPHTQDARNFGIWKPTGATDSVAFYTHNPMGNVWIEGNGCSAVLYDTSNPVAVFNTVKDVANKISSGTWPANRFYCMSVMINQRDFSAGFTTKVATLLDSINTLVAQNKVVWTSIREKFDTFQAWSSLTATPYSQWGCDETLPTYVQSPGIDGSLEVPNPFSENIVLPAGINGIYTLYDMTGKQICRGNLNGTTTIDTRSLPDGNYLLHISNSKLNDRRLLVKQRR